MHQLLFGALFPFLIAAIIYAFRHGKAPFWLLISTPPAMLFSAIWAVIPDIPRLFGAHTLYQRLATDPRINIFFWHYTIDQIETDTLDPLTPLFNSLFIVLMLLILIAALLELFRAEARNANLNTRTQ